MWPRSGSFAPATQLAREISTVLVGKPAPILESSPIAVATRSGRTVSAEAT
jgi:hypothetical protein